MEFFKKLFTRKQPEQPQFIQDLRAIQRKILPSFDPKQHEFKINLFKTYIKFRTRSNISLKEMRSRSLLKTAEITKQTGSYTWWRASYAEYQLLYRDPTIVFLQEEVELLIEKLSDYGNLDELNSVIEYEPSTQNILAVLSDAKTTSEELDPEVLHQSMHLLKRIVYEVEMELHQKQMVGKKTLIDQLKFEEKYMNRHDKERQ